MQICAPGLGIGGLTHGFWQNPNGQGLIQACNGTCMKYLIGNLTGCSTHEACVAGPYNSLYGCAFMDYTPNAATISSPAKCLGTLTPDKVPPTCIAKWVSGVMASASGVNMSLMLRAQSLATCLTAFFAQQVPTNKYGAGLPFDQALWYWTEIDKDVSSVFPTVANDHHGTVQGMLSYVSCQYNSAGSYYTNKAQQTLAKDMFDAINQNKAVVYCANGATGGTGKCNSV